ncbi:MAG: dephospho-CoA kinase [Gammaproteobacteria bacterium]
MLTIGLTGGIGSGKSTVANLFRELDVPVYDTDVMAHQLVEPGQPALDEIISVFGRNILDTTGKLDREKLKHKVFKNDGDRKKLENILHPRILELLLKKINSHDAPYCVAVIPLLVEHQWQQIVDRVLVVDTSADSQISRTLERDNMSESLVKAIIKSQASRDARLAAADDVIDNSRGLKNLKQQVQQLHEKYLQLAQHY